MMGVKTTACLLAALAVSAACGGGDDSGGVSTRCARTAPISVSRVNDWPGKDPEAYAAELAANCASLVALEGLPWFDRAGPCDAAHPTLCANPFREERRRLLRAMSAHKITTLVTSENSNAYGPRLISLEAFRAHVQAIREDALEVGLENVWLGAPSEPWAWEEGARERSLVAREEWPGEFVLPDLGRNSATGKPYFQGIAYEHLEVHPCRVADALASIRFGAPVLTVTDCGALLVPGVELAVQLAREALAFHRPLVFYDHVASDGDTVVDNAIGLEIHAQ